MNQALDLWWRYLPILSLSLLSMAFLRSYIFLQKCIFQKTCIMKVHLHIINYLDVWHKERYCINYLFDLLKTSTDAVLLESVIYFNFDCVVLNALVYSQETFTLVIFFSVHLLYHFFYCVRICLQALALLFIHSMYRYCFDLFINNVTYMYYWASVDCVFSLNQCVCEFWKEE